ncbi:MAG: type II toxin-antitoxin system RelE/ParE family toxin [Burkholderiales bacterium]
MEKDRPRSADSVIDRILESTERLGRFRSIGRIGRAPGTYELVVPGLPYIVVYQVNADDDEVIVIGVFHGAQDRSEHGYEEMTVGGQAGAAKAIDFYRQEISRRLGYLGCTSISQLDRDFLEYAPTPHVPVTM